MIYTVTLNPSIDYVIKVKELVKGHINRVNEEHVYPGGKGINVTRILKNLDNDNIALGFVSGFTGDYIINSLKELGLKSNFIKVEQGFTRINVKIKSEEETEINGQGPNIKKEELDEFYKVIDQLVDGDILILSGSIPSCLDEKLYEDIMKRVEHKNIKVVVDATKNLLLNVLKYKPFLIKPNNHELAEMFNVELNTTQDIIFYAEKLKEMGAQNVLISMGKDGALLVSEDNQVLISSVAKGEVVNSVGAGDSMVAGFISGYLKSQNYEDALRLGAASGGATAFSSDLAIREFIDKLVKEIKIQKIK
ncbi:MAG: 1-phosphofructokinase [Clostridiales bacterium]|uniref:1-phosphofructokinase n=1 Tax=Clostridium sp. 2218st1_F5_2218SCRN_220325 TaxID=3143056 RepID=UPI0025DD01AC|nr:1-phosphofructokinase [uncultured Intestinibacter sp.]MDU1203623.1 1-phosphofructokinase [Clostridiales bacterium]